MRSIKINGEIDKAAAERLRRDLDCAQGDDVVVEIDSHGGSFVAGLKMYADLKDYRGRTTARIIHAGSAATLPLCACDESVNTEKGTVFIHAPTAVAVKDIGLDIGDLRQAIGSLERTTNILAAIYAAKNTMGWPMHRAIDLYKTLMQRKGGTTWRGAAGGLIDRCEKPATIRAASNGNRPPVGVLGEIALGGFQAGVEYGAREAVATIAKANGRSRWCHSDGSPFGLPFANKREGDA